MKKKARSWADDLTASELRTSSVLAEHMRLAVTGFPKFPGFTIKFYFNRVMADYTTEVNRST